MKDLWNNLYLSQPPTSSWTTIPKNFDTKNFQKCLKKIYDDLKSQDMLHTEAAILSRMIYRMKSKFRSDKGLKNMEKVNRGLLNYLQMSLEKEYKLLADSIVLTDYSVTLPTKQMLEYVLTRTQALAKLMCQVEKMAQVAATFFMTRIRLGQAWTVSVICYSVTSRIWVLSRHLVRRCCAWYNIMHPYTESLQLVGVHWMPSNHSLPSDLKSWLAVPWIDEETPNLPTNEQLSDAIFNLIKHQDTESEAFNESQFSVEELSVESQSSAVPEPEPNSLIDIGEPVSRESFQINLQKQSPNKSKLINIKKIKTKEELKTFLTYDSIPGLDKLQWNIIKNMINRKLMKIEKCKTPAKQKILVDKVIQLVKNCIK